jgi:hypothetical protein
MKILHEVLDNEDYIDIVLTLDEYKTIKDNIMLSKVVKFLDHPVNLGITLTLGQEIEDAISSGKEQEDYN